MATTQIWLASGVRTPFAKVDGPLARYDSLELSIPVMKEMLARAVPDFVVWGQVVPSLGISNIAREVMMDAGADPRIPAFSTVMACSTSMIGAIEAAGMIDGRTRNLALVGGVDSLSKVQIGLGWKLSDWLRGFQRARSTGAKLGHAFTLKPGDIRLFIPAVVNRTSGLSMGEHTEITTQEWQISRQEQDELAFASHKNADTAWKRGFFDDLVLEVGGVKRDTIPRADTSIEKLAKLQPAFDRKSGRGTLSAGNSSPLTDGAASLWVASDKGLTQLPSNTPRVKLVDWEIASVDFRTEGLLMAPAYAIPKLLARNKLRYDDVFLWEIHEAFTAQLAFHMKALEDEKFLTQKAGIDARFGKFPRDRVNPNGGSVALGHPFGATGARILSQAVKELAGMPPGTRAIVSICADGGLGSVILLEAG